MITKARITMPSTQIKTISHISILSILGVEVEVSILGVVVAVRIVGGVVVGVVVEHVIESFLSSGYQNYIMAMIVIIIQFCMQHSYYT